MPSAPRAAFFAADTKKTGRTERTRLPVLCLGYFRRLFLGDGAGRANTSTGAAAYAHIRIDNILAVLGHAEPVVAVVVATAFVLVASAFKAVIAAMLADVVVDVA